MLLKELFIQRDLLALVGDLISQHSQLSEPYAR